ncbi:MAG TPA: 2-phospho-L-lactate transferase [Solirubrobacteraceae bacterium]|nr:2-phospho-L-lactate transferase [Solirubrobacteraceae bacterium]
MADGLAPVVVLAGGTGGAKLARGMLDVVGDDLAVVANTGDDIEIHGAHVSPDPDLCSFWLADRSDARGWGLEGDTFHVMEALRALGEDVWFELGDRDLAVGLRRAARLRDGARLTEVLRELGEALGLGARVLPMSDAPVRTWVRAHGRWAPFQEFMIRQRATGPVEDVFFAGAEAAAPSPEVLEALAAARAIVIGPSNPIVSIGPILAVPGLAGALHSTPAPVVAVSPVVGGAALKGPTEAFMTWAGRTLDAEGIADHYAGLRDGLVADEEAPGAGVPVLITDTRMADGPARERGARETLRFATGLGGRPA